MQLNPSEISDLIKKKIENFDAHLEAHTEGTVVSVTDGIVRVHGLSEAMQGEMLEFPGGSFGMALNLERDSVGVVMLGAYQHISEGDTVMFAKYGGTEVTLDGKDLMILQERDIIAVVA